MKDWNNKLILINNKYKKYNILPKLSNQIKLNK